MKYLLTLFTGLLSITLFGQITVDRNDFGSIGDTVILYRSLTGLDSVAPGPAGANQIWDFTSLSIDGFPDTLLFLDPAGFPQTADLSPNVNLVIRDAASLLFLETGTNGIYGHALTFDLDTLLPPMLLEATPKLNIHLFPMNFGLNFSGSHTANTITIPFQDTVTISGISTYVDSVRITPSLQKNDSIDAYGQIILPDSSQHDVLRQKSVLTISANIEALIANPLPFPPPFIWISLPGGSFPDIVNTSYSFIAKGMKYPVMEMGTDSLGAVISARFQHDTTSIDTLTAYTQAFDELGVFPNPVNQFLTINGIEAESFFGIYDALGKIQLEGRLPERKNVLDLSALPQGMYILQIESPRLNRITQIRILKN